MRTKTPITIAALALFAALCVACSGTAKKPVKTSPVITDPEVRDARIKADLDALEGHVETYVARYEQLPTRQPDLRDTPDGEPVIEELLHDPWNVPYLVRRLSGYDEVWVYSTGADLIVGSSDDIVKKMNYEGVELKSVERDGPSDADDRPEPSPDASEQDAPAQDAPSGDEAPFEGDTSDEGDAPQQPTSEAPEGADPAGADA